MPESTEPDWLEYQQLAAEIYRQLDPHAVVTHDDKIRGIESNKLRQIDVSIRSAIAGHDILIIVQAKNLKRKATINTVGEFLSVMRDVRAAKGVLICRSGFVGKAFEYAKKNGIDLCTIGSARSIKWPLDLSIPLLWIDKKVFVNIDMRFRPETPNPVGLSVEKNLDTWLISPDQNRSTAKSIAELMCEAWNDKLIPWTEGSAHLWEAPVTDWYAHLDKDYWVRIEWMKITYRTERRGSSGSFRFKDCVGLINKSTNLGIARAKFTADEIRLSKDPNWPKVFDVDAFIEKYAQLLIVEQE
jgi:hypothetical protein